MISFLGSPDEAAVPVTHTTARVFSREMSRKATTLFTLFHHQRIFPLKNLSAFMRRLTAAHLSSPTISLQNRHRNLSDLNLGLMMGSVSIRPGLAW